MQKIWLWTELGWNSDVSASGSSNHMIKEPTVGNNGESEESGSSIRSRVRVRCSIRSTGDIAVQLEFGSSSDVRVSA